MALNIFQALAITLSVACLVGCNDRHQAATELASVPGGSAQPLPASCKFTDVYSAVKLLKGRIASEKLYSSRTILDCLAFKAEKCDAEAVDMAVHEIHGGICKGDPGTSPVVDRFRVDTNSEQMEWYDAAGDLLPFEAALKERAKKQWFTQGSSHTTCIKASFSPAERIRMLGNEARVHDLPGGAVEVSVFVKNSWQEQVWTYYPSMSACQASLSPSIPSRYE